MENKELKVGSELEVLIGTVGSKGDGVAKVDDYVIFIPGTKEGDSVKVKITKVVEKIAFGEKEGSKPKTEEKNSNPEETPKEVESKTEKKNSNPEETPKEVESKTEEKNSNPEETPKEVESKTE